MHPLLILFVLFAAISLTLAAVMFVLRDLVFRRRALIAQRAGEFGPELTLQRLRQIEEPKSGSVIGRIDHSYGRMILETGWDMVPEAAFLAQVLVGLLVGGLLFLWRDDPLPGFGGFIAGMAITYVAFYYQRIRRQRAIRNQLPDVMDVLGRAVRAGESLDQAIELVGDTSPDPLGTEFRRCSKHLDMGLSMEAAMRSLTRRAPLTEMRILAATFMVQRQTGGNLPVTLERLAAVIRDRLSYYRQFRASTAASRIGTVLIALAGPAVAAYMLIWQPDYIRNFAEMPGGWTLLTVAIVLQVIGLAWILSLLRSDY